MASREIALPDDYQDLLKVLKERVRGSRAQAVRAVNSQLIGLYWSIGRDILQRQMPKDGAAASQPGWPKTFGQSARR
ncbi:hypothetical protein AB0N75_14765 [Arthrobacter sp. NPDC089319]